MNKDEVIFRLVDKVFELEDRLSNQREKTGDLISGISQVTDERDKALTRVGELEHFVGQQNNRVKADLESCNKEWRVINDRSERRVEELIGEVREKDRIIADLQKTNSDLAATLIGVGKSDNLGYMKNGRSFTCDLCEVTLSTRSGIEDHIQGNHSGR